MDKKTVLSVEHLDKQYAIKNDTMNALEDINLEIKNGEFISIVGPSGCGKSTFLRILSNLETITSGNVLIDGEEMNGPSNKMKMIFQESRLFPWLTIEKNIDFVLPDKLSKVERAALVDEYLELVGLANFKKAVPSQLSGGMQQRVSIARALVTKPEILLLDEPFGALDAFTRMNLQSELLRIWREQHNTMILVTHDIDEAIFLSDRIIIMSARPGKIKAIVDVKMEHPRDRSAYSFLEIRKKILEYFIEKPDDKIEYVI
jgi:sulfonate transport system ATP-binding protein